MCIIHNGWTPSCPAWVSHTEKHCKCQLCAVTEIKLLQHWKGPFGYLLLKIERFQINLQGLAIHVFVITICTCSKCGRSVQFINGGNCTSGMSAG